MSYNSARFKLAVSILAAMTLSAGCGSGGSSAPTASGGGGSPPVSGGAPAITATVDSGKITVAWDNVPGATSYNVYWSTDAAMTKDTATRAETNLGSFVLSAVVPGRTYYFFVTSVFPGGVESEISNKVQISVAMPNAAPVASLLVPQSRFVGDPVSIDASASADNDGSIVSYAFDFGDGGPAVTQASPFVSQAYANRGTFIVSLTVTDDDGATDTVVKEITIGLASGDIVNVSATPGWSQEPVAAVDSSGNIGVFWYEDGGVAFARSPGGNGTFDTRIGWSDIRSKYDQPAIAASNGDFYLTWTIFPDTGGAEIAFVRSTNGGSAFADPAIVSPVDGVNSYASSVAVNGSDVVIAWSDADLHGTGLGDGIGFARSRNAGRTFTYPPRIPGSCPQVALSNGKTLLAFRDSQVRFASTDNTGNFGAPIQVSATTENFWCPTMGLDPEGRIYILWPEGSAFTGIRLVLSMSDDGGATFSPPVVVSGPVITAACGSLAVGPDGAVMVVWTTGDSYSRTIRSFLVYSVDRGATFTPPMKIPAIDGESMIPWIVSRSTDDLGAFWASPSRLPPLSGTYVKADILYTNVVVPH